MARYMYDATHDNVSTIPATQMVAGYDTGTSDVKWTTADWNLFLGLVGVHIDQAYGGPVYSANVMDVEPGCYAVSDVVNWTQHCTAPRPTVYCDRNDLPGVQGVWAGDIWLAAADWSDATAQAYMAANPQIVAVQNLDAGPYDRSLVGDAYWPAKAPAPPPPKEKEMFHGTLAAGAREDIPFPVDTFDAICFYASAPGSGNITMIITLNAGGGSSTSSWTVTNPTTFQFPHPPAIAVSLVNTGSNPVGWTLVSD